MDKKKKRKIIWLSVCLALVVALIVGLIIYGNRKSGAKQFAQENSDILSPNPFVENEERSDNSLLEYGKVLYKYDKSGNNYQYYSGEDIVLNATDFYGISYECATGEMIYLYRGAGNKFETVTYRGKTYAYNDVLAKIPAFVTDEVVAEIEDVQKSFAFTEDIVATKKVDVERKEQFTSEPDSAKRFTEETYKIEADDKAIKTTSDKEITFIYKVDVKQTALYSLAIEYVLPKNRSNSALVSFKVDGKYPFKEAAGMELDRLYNFYDINSLDIGGNEIRAQQQEIHKWTETVMANPDGLYRNPYRFLLTESALASKDKPRQISITVSREPAVLRTIKLVAPIKSPSYEEYKKANAFSESKIIKGNPITMEMEFPIEKNSAGIRSEWDENYATSPASYKVTRYNYFGGDRWSAGGDGATWKFKVEKDGWYQIGFRYKNTLTDIVAYREVKIDGVIPFEDMEEYCFPYSDGWYAASMMDANQNPYYFYLTKGDHTITLTSKVGPLRASVQSLTEAMDSISQFVNTVVSITGAVRSESGGYSVDKNRDWDLDKYIAGIQDQMDSYRDTFTEIYDEMLKANGGVLPYYGSAVSVAKVLFTRLADDLEDIPSSLNEITNALSSLSTTLSSITEQPLAIDYMVVNGGDFDYSKCRSNGFQNLYVGAIQFKDSFVKDYSIVGTRGELDHSEDMKEIEVYVGRGREYVEMMRNLIAEDFTPKTGIKVNVNMVNGGVEGLVMLRYVTGTAPDVAISAGAASPVEYAARGALVAFNDLDGDGKDDNPDFEEFKKQFLEGAFVLSRYRGNYYSVPETQTWGALFYRTDIMKELGLEVPQTWDDVYAMLPILQENSMDFSYGYAVGNLYPFIYQHGASIYDYNGLESALNTDEAYDAFVEYSDLYNKYDLPYAANFYMKFKMGDMPIGIADMGTYCQLKYSAPEINGKWAMSPVPGHVKEDGTIDRSMSGSVTSCIMIKNKGDKLKSKEGYEFIKWWMSEETQIAYAQEVEATFGVGSRWNTANKNAIKSMAYTDDEVAVIEEQWNHFVESPNVLGGYYTNRYLTTALNQSVLQGENIRIALEDAVREINKEMKRKQKEFFPNGCDSVVWAEYKEKGDE